MAYYAYKVVRDLIPQFIIDRQGEDYEGTSDYDGDLWYAAEDYIVYLKENLRKMVQTHHENCPIAKDLMKEFEKGHF